MCLHFVLDGKAYVAIEGLGFLCIGTEEDMEYVGVEEVLDLICLELAGAKIVPSYKHRDNATLN